MLCAVHKLSDVYTYITFKSGALRRLITDASRAAAVEVPANILKLQGERSRIVKKNRASSWKVKVTHSEASK